MSSVMSPGSVDEALEMLQSAMGYLAAGRCHGNDGRGAGALPADA